MFDLLLRSWLLLGVQNPPLICMEDAPLNLIEPLRVKQYHVIVTSSNSKAVMIRPITIFILLSVVGAGTGLIASVLL